MHWLSGNAFAKSAPFGLLVRGLAEAASGAYPEEYCDGARRRWLVCIGRVLGEERSVPR